MKKLFTIILTIIFISISPCCVYAKKTTGLEKRFEQTQVFNTSDTLRVMKAAANTLQDSYFIIEEFEPEIGFIRARKTYKQRYINKGRLAGQSVLWAMATSYAVFTWGSTAAYMYSPTRKIADELHEKNSVIDTNILVENFGNKTKVRMVLVQKILQNAEGFSYTKSATLRAIRIYNPKVYEEFFNQINDKL
jgi:hypothetical protein